MGVPESIELFTRTFENRFVFNLFDLLLCGVIALVVVRCWRLQTKLLLVSDQCFLFLGFFALGASFFLGAVRDGAFLFFRARLPEAPFDLLVHTLWACAWLLLTASAFKRPARNEDEEGRAKSPPPLPFFLLVPLWFLLLVLLFAPLFFHLTGSLTALYPKANGVLDSMNVAVLAIALRLFCSRPLGGRNLATSALAFLLFASMLHLGSYVARESHVSLVFWNLEQFTWSFSLFLFALAFGETSPDLFDKVFVRLQIAFILLASVMILVMTQTEKSEYLANLRDRSYQLADFVRADTDYFRRLHKSLWEISEREDFLQRAIFSFGNLPELKLVRVVADGQVGTFEIAPSGEIKKNLTVLSTDSSSARLDSEEYFLIHSLPLAQTAAGGVEFYGTREFLDQHIRKRIILIFTLFTGMVALSTVMIGFVVHGASVTIRKQSSEILEAQRQLLQASKLAAVGELAAGVAHEINNPATTILSRASYLLSEEETNGGRENREDLKAIIAQAQRIAHITSGLLRFSSPQALRLIPVPVGRIIESSLRFVEEPLHSNAILVKKEVQAGLPRVLADEESLCRAFENLFRNAIDAMPNGGMLRVRATREPPPGARVMVEIADTGVAIEKDNLSRVFDPFFTTKEVGKGTGLGLSIVHGILKSHQGTIQVESQPGQGTKFAIALQSEA